MNNYTPSIEKTAVWWRRRQRKKLFVWVQQTVGFEGKWRGGFDGGGEDAGENTKIFVPGIWDLKIPQIDGRVLWDINNEDFAE